MLVTIEMTEIQKPVVENSMFMLSDIPESPSMHVFFKSLREGGGRWVHLGWGGGMGRKGIQL